MNLSKWILIGGGLAAFLFRDQIAAAIAGNGAADIPSGPPPAPSVPLPAPVATDAAGTRARMLAIAQTDSTYSANTGRMTAYQWNYIYRAVRGVDAPAPQSMGISEPAMLLTLDEYWTAAQSAGLSGLRADRPRRRSLAAQAWGA